MTKKEIIKLAIMGLILGGAVCSCQSGNQSNGTSNQQQQQQQQQQPGSCSNKNDCSGPNGCGSSQSNMQGSINQKAKRESASQKM